MKPDGFDARQKRDDDAVGIYGSEVEAESGRYVEEAEAIVRYVAVEDAVVRQLASAAEVAYVDEPYAQVTYVEAAVVVERYAEREVDEIYPAGFEAKQYAEEA